VIELQKSPRFAAPSIFGHERTPATISKIDLAPHSGGNVPPPRAELRETDRPAGLFAPECDFAWRSRHRVILAGRLTSTKHTRFDGGPSRARGLPSSPCTFRLRHDLGSRRLARLPSARGGPAQLAPDRETSLFCLLHEGRERDLHQARKITLRQAMAGKRACSLNQVAQLDIGREMHAKAIGGKSFELAPTRP
jgi:hypothetical protein